MPVLIERVGLGSLFSVKGDIIWHTYGFVMKSVEPMCNSLRLLDAGGALFEALAERSPSQYGGRRGL
jgi:hypothetical protein